MNNFDFGLTPLSGELKLQEQDEKHDYLQEIARSSFGDMVHDQERNQKYFFALKAAIDKLHARNKKANVLDIGTGTGLLSMMAVKCGADSVTACETLKPIAECAKEIIKSNGFDAQIKVISKNCMDVTVGVNGDMEQRANILVTEVFDTELIGEGAIAIFEHAHKVLLEKDCIVVPDSATIFAQVIESPLALSWCKLNPDLGPLKMPDYIRNCFGSSAVHDIQLSELPISDFKIILSGTPVIRFDWSGKTRFIKDRNNLTVQKAERDGVAQIVFMWWDLNMDTEGQIVLSCAPYWAQKDLKLRGRHLIPWRDHWMQAIYFIPKELEVKKGDEITLISNHDEFSLWFNVKNNLKISNFDYEKLSCDCALHNLFSRTRIGQINDSKRNRKYMNVLREKINEQSIVLCLGDFCLLGLGAALLGAKRTYITYNSNLIKYALQKLIDFNKIVDITLIDQTSLIDNDLLCGVSLVIGEPYFSTSLLPWHNLYFMHLIKRDLAPKLDAKVEFMPKSATLNAIAVEFFNLHKIKTNLNVVEGFDMKHFDDLIESSSNKTDEAVEPQPLWEYTGRPLTSEINLMTFQIETYKPSIQIESIKEITFDCSGTLNGIALWMDWNLDGSQENIITTGPIRTPKLCQEIIWDMHTRQGVYLLRKPIIIEENDVLQYIVNFCYDEVNFEFKLNGKII